MDKQKYPNEESLHNVRNHICFRSIEASSTGNFKEVMLWERATVRIDDEIIDWLAENTVGQWSSPNLGQYWFERSQDIMAFKLRWL